jgi:carbamoyl-phosphate synthase small subunit
MERKKATLVLRDGRSFAGRSFGYDGPAEGEIVFSTAMVGYPESLTDPSYSGQLLCVSFPLVGNYGIPEEVPDAMGLCTRFESEHIHVRGLVISDYSEKYSHWDAARSLDQWLQDQHVPGICGIDTRALTRIVREYGVLNCKIQYKPDTTDEEMAALKAYTIKDAVESTTCSEQEVFMPEGEEKYNVVLMDFGAKHNIGRELNKRGCKLTVVPAHTSAEEILALDPDGIMLSNGPGDPAENVQVIEELKKLCTANIPIFGICLGHQMISLAYGAKTYKLKFGHRGGNHPVRDLETGKIEITSQNHSFAVDRESLEKTALTPTHINLLDQTVEGVKCDSDRVFSVQYHPESAPGPQDSAYLFDRFIEMMEEAKSHA